MTALVGFSFLTAPRSVGAQEASPETLDSDESQETPIPVRDQIRALTLALGDRKTAEQAVEDLLKLGETDDRVASVVEHLVARSVYVVEGELVYIPEFVEDAQGEKFGDIYNLLTPHPDEGMPVEGEPLSTVRKGDAKAFKEQRRIRRDLVKVASIIRLGSANTKTRLAAAKRVGDKRDLNALDEIRALSESDPDPKVRRMALESLHLIVASGVVEDVTDEQRLDAVEQLGEMKSIRAFDMIAGFTEQEGNSATQQAVYDAALSKIDAHITTTNWILHVFRGVSLGSILILIALGLAITFGLMGVINMAHGEMLMIGAIVTWGTIAFLSGLESLSHLSPSWFFFIAFPIAFGASALVGLVTELTVVRHLYKRPLDSLLATIGVSFILIQGVRLITGDNLSKSGTEWATGGWEVYLDVVLPYNRLFLIGLSVLAVLSVFVIFRYTPIGLMIRATVQNREMAQSLGVNTRRVDMFTFSLGAGLAGIAGYGLYLTENVTPQMGQAHIVRAFLTVVVGGVGKLIGVVISGLGLGSLEKLIEPIELFTEPFRMFDPGWATVAVLLIVALFMRKKPAGLFPDKGRLADQPNHGEMPWLSKPSRKRDLWIGGLMLFVGLIVIPALYLTGAMSPGMLEKLGKYAAFAMVAIGLDLLWGYMGILSLCQFMFFGFGGYAMSFYLINHGAMDANGIPDSLSRVMSDVSNKQSPWYLSFFESLPVALILGVLITGLIAFVIGATTFRSRMRGVYFSIFSQAILVATWNIFIKNDLKMGGTNGLTDFRTIIGFPIADEPFPERADGQSWFSFAMQYFSVAVGQTRFWLYMTSMAVMLVCLILAHLFVRSRFGRILVAIRDDETRLRFSGYQTWMFKALTFVIAGVLAAIGGMLYAPLNGIITPDKMFFPIASIMVVVYVAVGGRATLWGAVLGTFGVCIMADLLTSGSPGWYQTVAGYLVIPDEWFFDETRGETFNPLFNMIPDGDWLLVLWSPTGWPLVLGATFVLVPLLLPGGLMSLPQVVGSRFLGSGDSKPDQTDPPTPVAVAPPQGGDA